MTTPPKRLMERLTEMEAAGIELIYLRGVPPSDFAARVSIRDAWAMACRGEIEGVGGGGGSIRYVRLLPEQARERLAFVVQDEATFESSSSVLAQMNMGVYRQRLNQPVIERDRYGAIKIVAESDQVIGHVWAHCGLRRAGY